MSYSHIHATATHLRSILLGLQERSGRLAQRQRAILRSIGEQVEAGELTEERLAYHVKRLREIADELEADEARTGRVEGAEVVDLRARRERQAPTPCGPGGAA